MKILQFRFDKQVGVRKCVASRVVLLPYQPPKIGAGDGDGVLRDVPPFAIQCARILVRVISLCPVVSNHC